MKSIFLSIVIICALVIAGIGGTFATLSDTEESLDNYIEVGSMDLKVNGGDDVFEGSDLENFEGVGSIITLGNVKPGPTGYTRSVDVENEGTIDGYLYMIIKSGECYNTLKEGAEGWIEDPSEGEMYSGDLKPEPEIVAEYGGWLAQQYIPGDGVIGDNCCMRSHTWLTVKYRGRVIVPNEQWYNADWEVIELGKLPACGDPYKVRFTVTVPQLANGGTYFNTQSPLDHYPTNALMADGLPFDILFILVDNPLDADQMVYILEDLPDYE